MTIGIVEALAAIARTRSQRPSEVWRAACDYAARELILTQPNRARAYLIATYQGVDHHEKTLRGRREVGA